MTCPDCGDRVDHCHGTLVLHADDVEVTAECIDPACDAPELASHTLVVGCGELGCPACATARTRAA
ncbi:MAG TPA: hypothetical protein VH969_13855 [Actinophytocola sp.]|uniref:hypothetical protein n=1 Tax=Actinophytocola sp. TaxID=1872138 RepID=UPI002F93CABA